MRGSRQRILDGSEVSGVASCYSIRVRQSDYPSTCTRTDNNHTGYHEDSKSREIFEGESADPKELRGFVDGFVGLVVIEDETASLLVNGLMKVSDKWS